MTVEREGRPADGADALGWTAALRTHRPFLSYNELGSLLDEGPSKLYDALSSILGLEELVEGQTALQQARLAREKAQKEASEARGRLVERLQAVEDERARRVVAALSGKDWDLAAVEAAVGGAGAPGADADAAEVLLQVASLEPPDQGRVAQAAAEMRAAAAAVVSANTTAAARSRDAAKLLEMALAFHTAHGDGDCPVCGREGALDRAWGRKQQAAITRLRAAAKEADAAHERAEAARHLWEDLAPLKGDALTRAAEAGLDLSELVEALGAWVGAKGIGDLERLAAHVETASVPLRDAVLRLRETARAQLQRQEDAWRPVAADIRGWLSLAQAAVSQGTQLESIRQAEGWLKKAAAGIRDDRFGPIAERAAGIWERLRQQSHVELGRIQLTGDGNRRRVVLDVTVDGVASAALGVMSQGELHALALSLFIPRATLPESPFRFIVIDDPYSRWIPRAWTGSRACWRARRPTARSWCSRTTTGWPRRCGASTSPPTWSRSPAARARWSSCAARSTRSGATWRMRWRWPARRSCPRPRPRTWCRASAGWRWRPCAWTWCAGAGWRAAKRTRASRACWATPRA